MPGPMAASREDARMHTEDDPARDDADQAPRSQNEVEHLKTKRAPPRDRTFEEINRWCTDDHSKEQIYESISDNIAPAIVSMAVSKQHTAEDHHESRDKSKKLKKHQREFIAESVKIAPLQVHVKIEFISFIIAELVYARRLAGSS